MCVRSERISSRSANATTINETALVEGLADHSYFLSLDRLGFVRFSPGIFVTKFSGSAFLVGFYVWVTALRPELGEAV